MSEASVRNRKRSRNEAEIATLAATFADGWQAGDKLRTWLRHHEADLARLLSEGWSYEDVGKAMFQAGIAYSTGAPIKPRVLANKVAEVRRGQLAKQMRDAPAKPEVSSTEAVPIEKAVSPTRSRSHPLPAVTQNDPDEEDEFRPARLLNWGDDHPAETKAPVLVPKTAPTPAPAGEMSAALARLLGRKANE